MKDGVTQNYYAPIIMNGGTQCGDVVNHFYNFSGDGKPGGVDKRKLAIECMNGRIQAEVAKGGNNWKKVFAPYIAAIRVELIPNDMNYEEFNEKYGVKISQSTFSSYVPKDIARSLLSETDTAAFENELNSLLKM